MSKSQKTCVCVNNKCWLHGKMVNGIAHNCSKNKKVKTCIRKPILSNTARGRQSIEDREVSICQICCDVPCDNQTQSADIIIKDVCGVQGVVLQPADANGFVAVAPNGSGFLTADCPDNAISGGNCRGINAVDLQMSRTDADQIASGAYSIIVGGSNNQAYGQYDTIVGGLGSLANGGYGFIGGGGSHEVGYVSNVVGGWDNAATGAYSSIVGGSENAISGDQSFIGGGSEHTISGNYSSIVGGQDNNVSGNTSVIVGGEDNNVLSSLSFIGSGIGNLNNGERSFIGGGASNTITGVQAYSCVIAGGSYNVINDSFGVGSSIVAGFRNIIGSYSSFGNNSIGSYLSFIGNGYLNIITGSGGTGAEGGSLAAPFGTIVNGFYNRIIGTNENYLGGEENLRGGSFIGAGRLNTIYGGEFSSIVGGSGNYIGLSGSLSTISGAFIGGGNNNNVFGYANVIVGGTSNKISGEKLTVPLGEMDYDNFRGCSAIVAGVNNSISSGTSFIGGGENNVITGAGTGTFIGGGGANVINNGKCSSIGGGGANAITGSGYASISGGIRNSIEGSNFTHVSGGQGLVAQGSSHLFLCGRYNDFTSSLATGSGERVFVVGRGNNPLSRDNLMSIDSAGNMFLKGDLTTNTTADYAEYFETEDGKPIPPGYSVCLNKDGKVRIASKWGDKPIGIISKVSSVIADAHEDEWHNKYLKDPFGEPIYEEVDERIGEYKLREAYQKKIDYLTHERSIWWMIADKEGELHAVHQQMEEDIMNLPTRKVMRPKLNPNYDPDHKYVPRSQRPEWVVVGLVGKIPLRKGQIIGSNWHKMKDINDEVELWLVK